VRVRATTEGSAKPAEVARALGVWGAGDDPRAPHARVARLGVVPATAQSRTSSATGLASVGPAW